MQAPVDEVLRLDRESRIANRAGELLRDCLLKQMGVPVGSGIDLWKTAKMEAADEIDRVNRTLDRKSAITQ
jgi:hypothetical protein